MATIPTLPSPNRPMGDGESIHSDSSMDSLDIAISTSSMLQTEHDRNKVFRAVDEGLVFSASTSDFMRPVDDYLPCLANPSEGGSSQSSQGMNHFTKFDLQVKKQASFDDDSTVAAGNTKLKEISLQTWRDETKSMEVEILALNETVRAYSINILKLKRSVDQAKEEEKHHSIQLQILTSRLRALKLELEEMEKAADEQHELERQHNETISFLKAEVDRLTKAQNVTGATINAHDQRVISRLCFENDLFATQIISNEAEMKRMKGALAERELELISLTVDMEKMRTSLQDKLQHNQLKIDTDELNFRSTVEKLSSQRDRGELERLDMTTAYAIERQGEDKKIQVTRENLISRQVKQEMGDKIYPPTHEILNTNEHVKAKDEGMSSLLVDNLCLCNGEILEHHLCRAKPNAVSSRVIHYASSTRSKTKKSPFKIFKGFFCN